MNGLYTINAPFFYALVLLNKLSLPYIIIAYLIPMKKQFMTWLLAITTMSAFAQQATVTGPDLFKSECIRKTRHPRLFRYL